jgi:hypothetical protein
MFLSGLGVFLLQGRGVKLGWLEGSKDRSPPEASMPVNCRAERRPSDESLGKLRDLADVSIREVSKYFETLPLTLDPTGNNPLVWAAEKGQTQIAGFLLEEGVDVNHRGYMGNTALARAARGGHVECLRVLLGFPDTNPNIAVYLNHEAATRTSQSNTLNPKEETTQRRES